MKKLLSLLLALALVFGLLGCQFTGFMEAPKEEPAQDQNTVQTPADQPVNWPELPSEEHTEEPSEEPTEEETIYDPRPHPADVQAEQDRLNQQQDRDEQNRQEQQDREEQSGQDAPPEQEEEDETPPEQESTETQPEQEEEEEEEETQVSPSGTYYNTKDEVALYIHLYGRLPDNYITKSQAKSLYGSTKNIPSNMNIGGDRFYNKEGLLPSGHTYYECDIGTTGGRNRGAKRIVFSTDGLIYYTDDHYASFTLLYGEP